MIRSTITRGALALGATTAAALALTGAATAQEAADIPIAAGAQSESIAALPDGGLILGSLGGVVYRVAPGGTEATPWISEGLGRVLGVFATEDTAYVCSNGTGEASLLAYDLATAAQTAAYPFPGGGFCNDIAAGPDGTIYVTDTSAVGRVLYLAPDRDGNVVFNVALASNSLAGADGIAFIADALFINDVRADELYRIDIDDAGVYGLTRLTLSAPIDGPDGMRTTEDGTGLLLVDNGTKRLSLVTVDGDNATITPIADGFAAATAVAQVGNTAYIVGAQFGGDIDQTAITAIHPVALP